MGGLHLASPPSVNTFSGDESKVRKGPQSNLPYSIRSHTTRSLPGSSVQHQSQKKGLENKVTRSNEFSDYSSSKSFFTCSDSYDLIPKECNVSSHCGLTELEVLSDYAYDRSTSETCSYNDRGDGLSSYETLPEVSLSEDSINCSGAPKSITFNSDEFDMVETTISSMEHQVINSDIGIQEKDYEFSVLDGRMTEAHIQINCDGDMHSKSFSNIPESLVLDSVSVGSYGDDGINANHDVKPFEQEVAEFVLWNHWASIL
ncbi:hypothetical protein GH714_005383 [Hevea brasiliensis]|uniref:Uncharacterized protein n=1 Tax=Hevea brasiliensis TaxID=3981 RepID=A0A6A6KQD1_HEVBR|nr:hypothetical protein GH714_005383 [Hevea brasiliensis]